MTSLLVSWLLMAVVIMVAAAIVPGVRIKGFAGAVWAALLLGTLNVFIGWLLFVVIGLATLGLGFILAFLTRWVVDALLLRLVGRLTDSLYVESFGKAFVAALVMGGLGTVLEALVR